MAGGNNAEKVAQSEWLQSQTKSKKKVRWVIGVILILFILGAAGGISAGVVLSKKSSKGGGSSGATSEANGGGGSGLSGAEDTRQNGDLNKDSPEIKALMSNARLKKIFHGMDYTPLNAVYPDCTSLWPTLKSSDYANMPRSHEPPNPEQHYPRYRRHVSVDQQGPPLWHGLQPDGNGPPRNRHAESRHESLARCLAGFKYNNQHPPAQPPLPTPERLPLG